MSGSCWADHAVRIAHACSHRIREEYSQNWFVDGLPAAQLAEDPASKAQFLSIGFDLGRWVDEEKVKPAILTVFVFSETHFCKSDAIVPSQPL